MEQIDTLAHHGLKIAGMPQNRADLLSQGSTYPLDKVIGDTLCRLEGSKYLGP